MAFRNLKRKWDKIWQLCLRVFRTQRMSSVQLRMNEKIRGKISGIMRFIVIQVP